VRAVVLAASPLETARILLSSDVDSRRWGIGRNLTDHMVASYVLLEPRPVMPPDGRGPFPGTGLIQNFVNLDEESRRPYRGGFSLELSGPTRLETLGIERMVASNETERWSATQIHAMGEVFPHEKRHVDLHPTMKDALGRPVPWVHVAWSDADREMADDMKKACISMADAVAVPGSRVIPFVDPLLNGAGHEAGTCLMGTDEATACDAHGRLRALDNVWVADASVMPSSGDRHPTLTVLAHAFRVADAVVKWFR
jgi:choline dehydrogenase-like flavoprotein